MDGKLWSINRRLIFHDVQHVREALLSRKASLTDQLSACLCGVLLAFTNSVKKLLSHQTPGWYLEDSPAAHCTLVSFKLLWGSSSGEEIYKPSPFAKAKLLIISQDCTYPPRPSTEVGAEKQQRPLSTIPIVSQDRQKIHLYQLFHFMSATGPSKLLILP